MIDGTKGSGKNRTTIEFYTENVKKLTNFFISAPFTQNIDHFQENRTIANR